MDKHAAVCMTLLFDSRDIIGHAVELDITVQPDPAGQDGAAAEIFKNRLKRRLAGPEFQASQIAGFNFLRRAYSTCGVRLKFGFVKISFSSVLVEENSLRTAPLSPA